MGDTMTAPYRLSVVIPTYQRRASVERLLSSLAHQTIPPSPTSYEVVVSIDGSQDGTREMVAAYAAAFPAPYTLRAVWEPNRGRASACNAGILAASGEIIVLLDDDMEASPQLLAEHARMHPAGARHGVVGAAPVHVDSSSSPVVKYVGAKFNRHLSRLARPGHHFKPRDFYSGNFSIRRDVLLQAGLFDEAFRIYGNEDVELSLRLAQADVELTYSQRALAYQHYLKDFAALAHDHIAKGHTAVLLAGMHPEIFHDLKLSSYRQAGQAWRLLRGGLLRLSRFWPRTVEEVIATIHQVERRRPARLSLYYALALDYCYWLGVQSALRENRWLGKQPISLENLAKSAGYTPAMAQQGGAPQSGARQ